MVTNTFLECRIGLGTVSCQDLRLPLTGVAPSRSFACPLCHVATASSALHMPACRNSHARVHSYPSRCLAVSSVRAWPVRCPAPQQNIPALGSARLELSRPVVRTLAPLTTRQTPCNPPLSLLSHRSAALASAARASSSPALQAGQSQRGRHSDTMGTHEPYSALLGRNGQAVRPPRPLGCSAPQLRSPGAARRR